MIAEYFGQIIPIKYLRDRVDLSRNGVSVKSLKECAESIGMKGYGVKIPIQKLINAPLPIILHWNQNHFAVLWKTDNNGRFHIADPSGGMLKYAVDEFQKHFCAEEEYGIALMLAPTDKFYTMKFPRDNKRMRIFHTLRESFAAHYISFLTIILLALVSLTAELCVPILLRKTIDEGIARAEITLVWLLIIAQIAIFTGSRITSSFSSYIINRLGLVLSMKAIDLYLTKLVSLPLRFFDSRVNADLIQKTYDREQMQQFIIETPTTIFLTFANILIFAGLLIWFNYFIFAIYVIMTTVGMIWETHMLHRRRNIDYDILTARARNNNNVYEIINGISDLKTHNAQIHRVGLWRKIQTRVNGLQQQSYTMRLKQNEISSLISQSRDLIITGLCATLVIKGEMTIGTMVTIAFVVGRLSLGFNTISGSLSSLQQATISLDRCNDVMDEPSEIHSEQINKLNGNIIFHSVSYKYPGADTPYSIDHIDLIIPQGKTTAIVGPSGCGKTTLMKLIQNLYQPITGKITVNNIDIKTFPPENWGEICTGVSQSGYLFSDTIAGNIALNEDKFDISRVNEAIKIACLDNFVNKLPFGINTLIGPTGMELSGGERQRILIARAIYRNTQIILLDEATSSLDTPTEQHIVENLKKFGEGRTMIIAAHRLSTIAHADLIIFMNIGQVIECGTHEELLKQNGQYASFVKGQMYNI